MSGPIAGRVDNGRRGQAQLPFYTGEVGVTERAGMLELAWFGRPLTLSKPAEGELDGVRIRVNGLTSRELSADPGAQRGSSLQAIIAMAELVGRTG